MRASLGKALTETTGVVAATAVILTAVASIATAQEPNQEQSHPRFTETPAPLRERVQVPDGAVTPVTAVTPPAAYVVTAGDTLSGIAQTRLGDSLAWRPLWVANQGAVHDPNLIYPGQALTMPTAGAVRDMADVVVTAPVAKVTRPVMATPARRSVKPPAANVVPHTHVNPRSYGGFQACVISRESGGNSQVMNSTQHYGLYQFDYRTWVSGGGSRATFGHASVAEQNAVFNRVYAARGTNPWRPYDGC